MAWIESHQQLERHPKTHELMRLMGWDRAYGDVALDVTIGKLHRFWWWCLDFAPTGDLHGKNDAVLAGSVGLALKDGKRFVDAMVASCWIDRDGSIFRVHDWIDYAGRYLKDSKFRRNPQKLLDLTQLYGRPPDDAPADSPPTVRRTKPDLTGPDQTKNKSTRTRAGPAAPPEFVTLIPPPLETPAFEQAWSEWEQHRREIGHRLKQSSAAKLLAKCEEIGAARAVAAIDHSIGMGYQGLFEPSPKRDGSNGRVRATTPADRWQKTDYKPG